MKKTVSFLIFLLFMLSLLSGCEGFPLPLPTVPTESTAPSSSVPDSSLAPEPTDPAPTDSEPANTWDQSLKELQERIAASGAVAGVASLGYVSSELSMADFTIFVESHPLAEQYPFLNLGECFMTDGQEAYAIVPPCEVGTITVYAAEPSEQGELIVDRSVPLFEGKPGEVLLLRCNLSEIYSNVMISVTDGGGAIQFQPSLSMENGRLQEVAGVFDFTEYDDGTDSKNIEIATEILYGVAEVRDALDAGMTLLYTGDMQEVDGRECFIFALGTEHSEQFVCEQFYAVCDNLVYAYDALNDGWSVVSFG